MERKLTLKQKKFIEEYLKTGNATEAIKKSYPNVTKEGVRRAMASENLTKPMIKAEIEERLNTVLGSREEKLALAEKVISKLQRAFNECKVDKDIDKLGRTLLEVTGAIGSSTKIGIGINNFPASCEDCPNHKGVFIGLSEQDLEDLPSLLSDK